MAYKKDIADTRESPAYPIAQRLISLGARLSYHDPYIAELPDTRSWPGHPVMRSVPIDAESLARYDAVLIVTDHSNIDYAQLQKHAHLIIDSRGVYRGNAENVVRA
jgi:UDP-N-acetyl-D-glucosamine dehydrogenase